MFNFFYVPILISSCWLSYTNNLIWIFVAFMAFVELVSLWSLASSFCMPGLNTGRDYLSRSHDCYKTKNIFMFSTARLKVHDLANSIYAYNVFSITRHSNKHSANIWHSLFVSAQHFDTRPSHKRDDHPCATYGGRHPYQADTVRFKISI